MKRALGTLLTLLVLATPALSQSIAYEIGFDNRDHHEAEVYLSLDGVPSGTLELRMSRSSPGRYALHEFAKNIYDVRVTDGRGRALEVSRPDQNGWNVSVTRNDARVDVRYTVFGDRVDGTYLAIDNTHAHINMPATFLWSRGMGERSIRLRIDVPDDTWTVATQLAPTKEANVFEAPNLDYFMDSPVEVSHHELHEWIQDGYRFRLALHHEGSEAQGGAFATLAAAVVREESALYGELPELDFGTYTFIADYLPYASGDGMEHRNSTILTSSRSLDQAVRNLGTVAHEFFHAWNVERIRPRSLEPFDFERANMSGELWFAEGFTSYYDDLTLKRCGIISLDRYAREITSSLNPILNAPGRRFFSPVEMSERAPFVDAAVSVDPTNRANIFASYYPYGAVLGLGLDLTLRSRFPGKSLDDFMRAAWRKYGRTEIPYDVSDLERLLADVTGKPRFARDFFARYIYASELPDYEALLAFAGLELRLAHEGKASLGARVKESGGRVLVRSAVLGGPAYEAGLDREDVILELDGQAIGSRDALARAVGSHAPSDRVTIAFDKRGVKRKGEIVLAQDPAIEVVPFESLSKKVTPGMRAFRKAWLQSTLSYDLRKHCHECGRSFGFEKEFCPYDGRALKLVPKP